MSMIKRYLENLSTRCSEHQTGQEAVEWAILSGLFQPTYKLDTDLAAIMGDPLARFDAFEVRPTKRQGCNYEQCDRSADDIVIWTVYGHLPAAGLECLSDHPTEPEAEAEHARLSQRETLYDRTLISATNTRKPWPRG